MAAWVAVFRAIPWIDLIAAAPGVARGAKKLWTGIRSRPRHGDAEEPEGTEDRLQRLEAQVIELRTELSASSEVIRELAEQNGRLVEAVGILRVRVRALIAISVVLLVLGVALGVQVWSA
jgi:hypothetical protein